MTTGFQFQSFSQSYFVWFTRPKIRGLHLRLPGDFGLPIDDKDRNKEKIVNLTIHFVVFQDVVLVGGAEESWLLDDRPRMNFPRIERWPFQDELSRNERWPFQDELSRNELSRNELS